MTGEEEKKATATCGRCKVRAFVLLGSEGITFMCSICDAYEFLGYGCKDKAGTYANWEYTP